MLQNNESDDEPIAADGEFTFDTPQTPGTSYNVSVKAQPSNPAQTCSVENGSGLVPTEDVTNVAVTCAEPVLGDLVKVAAEGDTLPDSTVLTDILLDGGVAINLEGQVAFGGRDGDGTDAVFTQAGKVVAEGDTLDDGTILAAFRGQGEVGINAGQGIAGDKVAFHGQAETGSNDTAAVFTQTGKVAAVGDILSEGITLKDIAPEGKVAINNADQVAFHGSVAVEDGFSDKQFRVILIADDVETWIDAREGSKLPDGTPLDDITESGGVVINDLDVVAFHGQTGSSKAVFTSWGLAAREGTDLPDGTILDDINENGGVAINLLSKVAFHGQTVVPDRGGDSLKAVFIADEGDIRVVAKVGDVLPDGSRLDDIEVSGGVAINLYDDVVFHGQTGGVKAVFNQNGVIAKVGDNVNDGSTLEEISSVAGVAVNPYGRQAAFHGRVNSADAVFVSLTPTPNAKPVADFTYEADNLTANFTDLSRDLDGDVVAWSWQFGDGGKSTEQNPSYTYASAGSYTVSLTVEDDQGDVSEPAEDLVEVSEPSNGNVVQVFVTDTTYFGDIGGLAGADAECQARAERASLTGKWTAWLSTTDVDPPGPGGIIEGVDARDRIPDGQYQLVDGTIIANDKDDLTDGSLNAPINLDQFGNSPSAGVVWTGTNLRGTFSGTNCSNWTTAGGSQRCAEGDDDCGDRGNSSITTPQWTKIPGAPTTCNSFFHLYCFGGGE